MFIFRSLCFIIWFLVLFQSGKDQKLYTIDGLAQGTTYSIRYFAASELVTKMQIDSVLLRLDSSMSLYKPYSLISAFNNSAQGIRMDADFMKVINKSFEVYRQTGGKFDITVAPLVQLWGFGPSEVSSFPDSLLIQKTLKIVGMKQLKIKGNKLFKTNPKVQIDLNGIAQGYSVDVVAGYLKKKGLQSYMVEVGGEVFAKGPKPDGSGYSVGIEGPGTESFRHIIELSNGAVTTSGNYQKFLRYKHGKISHLIDPSTGYPLNNEMISVTVYAKDAVTADGYDNALMAMNLKEAISFVNRSEDLEAYFIYRMPDGRPADTLTNGFKKLLVN